MTESGPEGPTLPAAADGSAVAELAWTIEAADSGERVDVHVAKRLDKPRNQIQRWLTEGRVQVDGRPVRASLRLEEGSQLSCSPPAPVKDERIIAEDKPLEVLYEDARLAVLDKPAGVAMHPGAGRSSGTLAHRILARYPETQSVGGPGRPGIVHRLDIGTSGVVVIARTERCYQALSRSFAEREVQKSYLALSYGQPSEATRRIEAPIARHRHDRKQMAVRRGGRPAVSELHRRESTARLTLFEVRIETGRTHQIRVHLKHAGYPIVGDPLYGEARWRGCAQRLQKALRDFPRPALHAWRLAFPDPETGGILQFEAKPAADLEELWTLVAGRSVSAALDGS